MIEVLRLALAQVGPCPATGPGAELRTWVRGIFSSRDRTPTFFALSKDVKPVVASSRKEDEAEQQRPAAPGPGPKRRGPDEDDRAEDRDLVRRIKAGEKDLFSRLVMKYHGRIYTVVCRILASPQDAEEATQDAFVAAYRKIDTFREQAQFYSWLYRIATNHALNRIRSNKARRENQKQSLDAIIEDGREHYLDDPSPSPGSSPDGACEESEWMALVEQGLEELAPMYRSIVVLRDVEGLTYEEISMETGLALGTVKSRLHAGRSGLRKILEGYGVSLG